MKRLIASLICLSAVFTAPAQTITVQAPNLVKADEQFNVAFIFEDSNPKDFAWDCGDDFQVVWGPQRGSSSSTSIVNGKVSKSSRITYTYVLMPVKEGVFNLPAAQATIKGSKVSSNPVRIEVVGSVSASSSGGTDESASSPSRSSDAELVLRLELSRTKAVVGEPVSARLVLYKNANVTGLENAKFPSFNGFWSEENDSPKNIEFHREKYNGKIYDAAVIRSYTLIPQQAGDIKIDPAELICLVAVRTRSNSSSIFDSFFDDAYATIRKRVVANPVTVHVSRLPSGAPASFGGGVGKFTMSVDLSRDTLKTHEAASIVVRISGEGNVSLLEAPKIKFPHDFEVYDVKSTDKSSRNSGSKTFEYPFIPRSHGDFNIPSVEYSYYDSKTGKYVSLNSGPITLHVLKSAESSLSAGNGQMIQAVIPKDVKDLASDIRFIETAQPSFAKAGSFFIFSWQYFLTLLILALSGFCAWVILRKLIARRADVVGRKNRKASKLARKKLARAVEFLNAGLASAFYEELHKALIGFVGDKLNMDLARMSRENIREELVAGGVDEALAAEFTGLLDACEFARYSPQGGTDALRSDYEKALGIISMIDGSFSLSCGNRTAGVKALVLFALICAPLGLRASAPLDSLWKAGTSAYASENWESALQAWQHIEEQGLEAPALYCNMGNAFFRMGDNARAVLYYERALRIDPSYEPAHANLGYVSQMLHDKFDTVPEFFLGQWFKSLCRKLPSDTWAWLSIFFFALALIGILAYIYGRSSAARKGAFFSSIAFALIFFFCLLFAGRQWSDCRRENFAIVMRPVVSVKSTPGGSSGAKELFILHEGTKIKILETIGDWYNVQLADGRLGWITVSELEKI